MQTRTTNNVLTINYLDLCLRAEKEEKNTYEKLTFSCQLVSTTCLLCARKGFINMKRFILVDALGLYYV